MKTSCRTVFWPTPNCIAPRWTTWAALSSATLLTVVDTLATSFLPLWSRWLGLPERRAIPLLQHTSLFEFGNQRRQRRRIGPPAAEATGIHASLPVGVMHLGSMRRGVTGIARGLEASQRIGGGCQRVGGAAIFRMERECS